MSRTTRKNHGRWLRTSPATQQERRQYYAALDQEVPVRVRGKRRPDHLPDSWTELRLSSYQQFIHIGAWLWKHRGKPWDRVFRAAVSIPTCRTAALNRQFLLHAVHTQTYMRNGEVWAILPDGNHIQSGSGFLVHPETGRLTHRSTNS
jgi:hypothetical protein